MKVEMLETRNINGKIINRGEVIEIGESWAVFLIARKEAKKAAEKQTEKTAEQDKKTAKTKSDIVNV